MARKDWNNKKERKSMENHFRCLQNAFWSVAPLVTVFQMDDQPCNNALLLHIQLTENSVYVEVVLAGFLQNVSKVNPSKEQANKLEK